MNWISYLKTSYNHFLIETDGIRCVYHKYLYIVMPKATLYSNVEQGIDIIIIFSSSLLQSFASLQLP